MRPPHTQVLAFVLYHVLTSLIFEPTALSCFNAALERLKGDPRITVRIGSADDIRGEAMQRAGKGQHIQNGVARPRQPAGKTNVGSAHDVRSGFSCLLPALGQGTAPYGMGGPGANDGG